MKVLINGTIHDAENEAICLVLSTADVKNLSSSFPHGNRVYLSYPPDVLTDEESDKLVALGDRISRGETVS